MDHVQETKAKQEPIEHVRKDIPRYEVSANGQTVEMTNSKPKALKAFGKSNTISTVLYEINAGVKRLLESKANHAGEKAVRADFAAYGKLILPKLVKSENWTKMNKRGKLRNAVAA